MRRSRFAAFLEARARGRFHSIILTHYHLVDMLLRPVCFPRSTWISWPTTICRRNCLTVGERSAGAGRQSDPIFERLRCAFLQSRSTKVNCSLSAGNKHFRLMHLPGPFYG
jgi:hypothetical protein